MYKIEEYKNKFIESIAVLTGIEEEKILEYSKQNSVFNILEHPSAFKFTKEQSEKIMLLNHIISSYDLIKTCEHDKKVCISCPEKAAYAFKAIVGNLKDKEKFIVGFLDNKNYIIEAKTLSEGSVNYANICLRNMLKMAINNDCSGIILCHNHPSGIPKPSEEDIRITQDIVNAFKSIKIEVLDHIIIGDNDFYSFKKEGIIFDNKINDIFNEQLNQSISF